MPRGRLLLLSMLLLAPLGWFVQAQPTAKPVELNGHTFTLQPGFEIELVAGPPLVKRPITAAFDEQGRLYVAESSGSNEPVAQQLEKKPHSILRLEDSDGDGKFDKSTVFADKMMFPEGTMWLDGSLYVAAPPSIWKLTDTDGDGKADKREEWFNGKTLTGCANDLHGPYRGPDGWIYWCKGAFAKQEYTLPNGKPFVTRASHIFRCRPDGSGIEPVMTGGMDNPVDTAFLPNGDRFFTTTFFQHPGGGKRDGLIHAIYGGLYGKDHDPVYEHIWTNPQFMPVLTHLGPAAPCGLHRLESDGWGAEFRDNLFACQFNLRKVSRHVLNRDGSSYRTEDSDFVVSNHQDFHPTDVIEDADGSLLIVDTGGWYKLCCPTSQLVKPDVFGGIYRVRKKGTAAVKDPWGRTIDWAGIDLKATIRYFDDPRAMVRQQAIERFARQNPDAALRTVTEVWGSLPSVRAKQNALWATMRFGNPDARKLARLALADRDESVRLTTLHGISLHRDGNALSSLLPLLSEPSLAIRRAAAEALGRIGDASAVPALLSALVSPTDRGLEHALIYAMIEINAPDAIAKGLTSKNTTTVRGAMVALDQLRSDLLKPETVLAAMNAPAGDPAHELAWWIIGRHPEWGEVLATHFRKLFADEKNRTDEITRLTPQLARFAKSPAVQRFLADRVSDFAQSPLAARVAVQAMAAAEIRQTPESWIPALTKALGSNDVEFLREVLATLRRLPALPTSLIQALNPLVDTDKLPLDVQFTAMALLPAGKPMPMPRFSRVLPGIVAERPAAMRVPAVEAISKAELSREQLLSLMKGFELVGPMDIDKLLEPYARSTDEEVGRLLIGALKVAPARSALRVDAIKTRLAKYPPRVQQEAETLYALLNADLAQQRAKLESMLSTLKGGDIRRGQAVFNSAKAACISCHAVGYVGGKVGPDLTRIGKVRVERDLLEAILFPSASFVRSYEPVSVVTKSGKVINGILRKDAPDEVVLAVDAQNEVRIARGDIEEMEPGKVSVMPAGLDQQLTPQELADLVAFLKACQ